MPEILTTREAAELAGITPAAFRRLACRARESGFELHARREDWPDGRTPMWCADTLTAYLAGRPGSGWHGPHQ